VKSFTSSKPQQHHPHFRLGKVREVVVNVSASNVKVPLCEEAKDVGEELLFLGRQLVLPILDVFKHRNFCMHPMRLFML